jgi:hypothetical protein
MIDMSEKVARAKWRVQRVPADPARGRPPRTLAFFASFATTDVLPRLIYHEMIGEAGPSAIK